MAFRCNSGLFFGGGGSCLLLFFFFEWGLGVVEVDWMDGEGEEVRGVCAYRKMCSGRSVFLFLSMLDTRSFLAE